MLHMYPVELPEHATVQRTVSPEQAIATFKERGRGARHPIPTKSHMDLHKKSALTGLRLASSWPPQQDSDIHGR